MAGSVSVWLVERTFSDDEQNLIIATYATEDGMKTYRKELAVSSLERGPVEIAKHAEVHREDLMTVEDEDTRAWYREVVDQYRISEDSGDRE